MEEKTTQTKMMMAKKYNKMYEKKFSKIKVLMKEIVKIIEDNPYKHGL